MLLKEKIRRIIDGLLEPGAPLSDDERETNAQASVTTIIETVIKGIFIVIVSKRGITRVRTFYTIKSAISAAKAEIDTKGDIVVVNKGKIVWHRCPSSCYIECGDEGENMPKPTGKQNDSAKNVVMNCMKQDKELYQKAIKLHKKIGLGGAWKGTNTTLAAIIETLIKTKKSDIH